MAAADPGATPATPPLLGWPFSALPLWARLALVVIAVVAAGGAAYWGSHSYPAAGGRQVSELEARIVRVARDPTVASWDEAIIGDLLVERFYVLDLSTGDRYISDFLKGRITGIEDVRLEDQPEGYVFLLDSKDMRRDRAFYNAYISTVSHPAELTDAFYLGVIPTTGISDAFPVNYNGTIPLLRGTFRQGNSTDVYEFMVRQNHKEITAPRGMNVFGYNYVLSTGEVFPLFRNEYRLENTIFVSELVIVDTTSRPNKATYYRLLEQYRRTGG